MSADLINGLFESGGCVFLFMNCLRIYKDKCYKGVSPFPFIFYAFWGVFNLFFYPSVGLIYSFYGGIGVVFVNTIYCFQMWLYRKGE